LRIKAFQALAQGEVGLVVQGDIVLRVRRLLGEGGAVQARLVAKIIADGGRIRAGRLRQFARGRLGVTLFGKQADGAMQQALARLLAIGARLAPVIGMGGGGSVFSIMPEI